MLFVFRDSRPTGAKVWATDLVTDRRWVKDAAEAVELDGALDDAGLTWPNYPNYPIYPWDILNRIPETPNAP